MSLKQKLALNLKHIIGKRVNKKIVVFSIDDYGNVRLASKQARKNLDAAGLKVYNHFDAYDSLENEEDLLMLYDALSSVKDVNGSHAVFTPFAVPANINFEKMREEGFKEFHYELLPETFNKIPGYEKVYDLWKEGIEKKFLKPQFHGREHVNLKVLMYLLDKKDKEVLVNFENRSFTSISSKPFPTINYTAAFEYYDYDENEKLKEIIEDGLDKFEEVFGYRSNHFNPPGGKESSSLHETLAECGIKYIDTARSQPENLGRGNYTRKYFYTGKKNQYNQMFLVRNVVFEPTTNANIDWVKYCMLQIETAFKWNVPANISSHRVNFCGNIEPKNREKGVGDLKNLLKEIVKKWPDVTFMSSDELGDVLYAKN